MAAGTVQDAKSREAERLVRRWWDALPHADKRADLTLAYAVTVGGEPCLAASNGVVALAVATPSPSSSEGATEAFASKLERLFDGVPTSAHPVDLRVFRDWLGEPRACKYEPNSMACVQRPALVHGHRFDRNYVARALAGLPGASAEFRVVGTEKEPRAYVVGRGWHLVVCGLAEYGNIDWSSRFVPRWPECLAEQPPF